MVINGAYHGTVEESWWEKPLFKVDVVKKSEKVEADHGPENLFHLLSSMNFAGIAVATGMAIANAPEPETLVKLGLAASVSGLVWAVGAVGLCIRKQLR